MKHPSIRAHLLIILSFDATHSCWKKALNQKYLRRPTAFYGRRNYVACMDNKYCTVCTVSWIWHVTKSRCSEDSYLVSEFHMVKAKVKCTLVQALRLCTGRTAHRGSRGIALLFLDHDTRRGWGVSVTPRPFFTPGKDPVPIVQEAGWSPRPVWIGAENLAPTGIRSRTVQPVASRYTVYATQATNSIWLSTLPYHCHYRWKSGTNARNTTWLCCYRILLTPKGACCNRQS